MRILITGATGFVGRQLLPRLADDGHELKVLSRDGARAGRELGVTAYSWDYAREPVPAAALEGVESIVHLMGENVGQGRWSAARKRDIRASRIDSTERLVTQAPSGLASFVSASAIGYYPGEGDAVYDESYRQHGADSFMESLCRDWEAAAAAIEDKGVRRVSLRFGLVLGHGGLLAKLLPMFRLGLGGPVGDGQQWVPWIHIDDLVEIIVKAIGDSRYAGAINAVGPQPVRYEEFAKALGRAVHRPALIRAPAIALRLALGEAADLALNSYRVVPERLTGELGFQFGFADLDTALHDLTDER
jgi:uncharacterized protein (TIGR01777 family)